MTGRFAPSPSGRMHLGNAMAALLSWLSVRHENGTMVLRIEDLDPARCRAEYAEQLKDDLRWLGLDWDTEQTPQSKRSEAYRAAFEALQEKGLIYPCYCSRNQLLAASAPHTGEEFVYAGTCRNLSAAQRAQKAKQPSWRVIVPDETVSFHDGLQGEQQENLMRECGDFIVRRADGVYAYQLAVVVDDAAAGVTQVVRGRDLLSSTARQMYLQKLLGFSQPAYYHVPLLVAPDGRRLSKREKDLDFSALRECFTPEALVGKLAFAAGLLASPERVSAEELAEAFDWKRIKRDNIVVDGECFD